ncbi:MAG TPA: hypothetical protein VKN16_00540 [Methylomirabilota bacterium]|nr:hypothetical protein [Methylomirabilota bacterium]
MSARAHCKRGRARAQLSDDRTPLVLVGEYTRYGGPEREEKVLSVGRQVTLQYVPGRICP